MQIFYYLCLLFVIIQTQAQTAILPETNKVLVDSLYREDQFYFGFTYNAIAYLPADASQTKFSTGIQLGFLRDMPINKNRTIAFASGLGLAYNTYIQNIAIVKTDNTYTYSIIDSDTGYNTNRFSQLSVEVPLEFRWRNSTPENHKFWRVYTGMKLGYLLNDRYVYKTDSGKTILKNNPDFNQFLYGIYLASGYNTFNFYVYYGLNKIFTNATVDGNTINSRALQIGLMFYIL
jgi:hypothetical protein